MKLRHLSILLLFVGMAMTAKPAKPGLLRLMQPDGTVVEAYIHGDEFHKLFVSVDGHALTRDADGYYSYAVYDAEGVKCSTSYHYGSTVPSHILASSSNIPYKVLAEKAALERRRHTIKNEPSLKTRASGNQVASAVILLAEFQDLRFKHSPNDFDGLLRRCTEYFQDQFGNTVDFEFTLGPVVTLSKGYAYYGKNGSSDFDSHPADAVAEACELSNAYIDFSRFDNDGDGCVDNIFLFYAGPDEAEGAGDDYIWSHSWDIETAGVKLSLDGVRIRKYALTSELIYYDGGTTEFNGPGPFCHEFSHLLGLCDLYDTDYEKSGGQTEGVWGRTSIMDMGSYNDNCQTPPNFNALEREMLRLGKMELLAEGSYSLDPVNVSNKYYRLNTGVDDDYYLFECRNASGWDKFIGGSGLLVYHIDKSSSDAGYSETYQFNMSAWSRWLYNEVNCNPEHMCAGIVPAARPVSDEDISSIFFPGTNSKYTSCRPYEGSFYSLQNISKDGAAVKFIVAGCLYLDNLDAFQDAALVNWHIGTEGLYPVADLRLSADGQEIRHISVTPTDAGTYSASLGGLQPKTEYELKIQVELGGGDKAVIAASFKTDAYYEGTYPFIYLNRVERYPSGYFKKGAKLPLKIYNVLNIHSARWMFNGVEIKVDPATGYYTVDESGRLSVEYISSDGKRETIVKDIKVK